MRSGSLLLKGIYFEQVKKGALIFSTPDWNELLPRGLPTSRKSLKREGEVWRGKGKLSPESFPFPLQSSLLYILQHELPHMRDVVLVREGVLRRPRLARGADGGPPAGHVAPDFGGLGCGGFRRVVQDARFPELAEQRQGFGGEAGGLGVPVEQERDVRGKRLRQRRPCVIPSTSRRQPSRRGSRGPVQRVTSGNRRSSHGASSSEEGTSK